MAKISQLPTINPLATNGEEQIPLVMAGITGQARLDDAAGVLANLSGILGRSDYLQTCNGRTLSKADGSALGSAQMVQHPDGIEIHPADASRMTIMSTFASPLKKGTPQQITAHAVATAFTGQSDLVFGFGAAAQRRFIVCRNNGTLLVSGNTYATLKVLANADGRGVFEQGDLCSLLIEYDGDEGIAFSFTTPNGAQSYTLNDVPEGPIWLGVAGDEGTRVLWRSNLDVSTVPDYLAVLNQRQNSTLAATVAEGEAKLSQQVAVAAEIRDQVELIRDQALSLVSPENIFVDVPRTDAEAGMGDGVIYKIVDTSTGIATVYKKGELDALYTEVTGAALASGALGFGASLVRALDGETVQAGLDRYLSPNSKGGIGGGVSDDTDAFLAACTDGRPVSGYGQTYRLTSSLDLTGRDLDLDHIHLMADNPVTVTVGGVIDNATTITLAINAIDAGARELAYDSITGPLGAGDWIVVKGHMVGAHTTGNGRTVVDGWTVRVRDVDTDAKKILLDQAILGDLDTQTIDGVEYGLSVIKIIPQIVNADRIITTNVNFVMSQVIDSSAKVLMTNTVSAGFSSIFRNLHGCDVQVVSHSRALSSGSHSVIFENHYNCDLSVGSSAVNKSHGTTSDAIAKVIRYTGMNLSRFRTRLLSSGLAEVVGMCSNACQFDMLHADSGTYNTDNAITIGNRNDSTQLNWDRGSVMRIQSYEADATPFELDGCWGTQLHPKLHKKRNAPNADAGFLTLKNGCRDISIIEPDIYLPNDTSDQAIRIECSELGLDGRGTYGIRISGGKIVTGGTGIQFRSGPASAIDIDSSIIGTEIISPRPVIGDANINGVAVQGTKQRLPVSATGTLNCIVAAGARWSVEGNILLGTSGVTRRAVSLGDTPKSVRNNWSDGGYLYYFKSDRSGFDLKNWAGNNAPIFFSGGNTLFYPTNNGGYSCAGTLIYDDTAGDVTFRNSASNMDLNFEIGQAQGDELKVYNGTNILSMFWDADTGYWRPLQRKRKRFAASNISIRAVAPGKAGTLTIPANGVSIGDQVEGWHASTSAADTSGLSFGHAYCVTDAVQIPYRNNTDGNIDVMNLDYFATVIFGG